MIGGEESEAVGGGEGLPCGETSGEAGVDFDGREAGSGEALAVAAGIGEYNDAGEVTDVAGAAGGGEGFAVNLGFGG